MAKDNTPSRTSSSRPRRTRRHHSITIRLTAGELASLDALLPQWEEQHPGQTVSRCSVCQQLLARAIKENLQ